MHLLNPLNPLNPQPQARLTVVVMGVSGCGKSAVAQAVAQQLGLRSVDGDDLHAPEAVAKMRAGVALCDADRWPWLGRVGAALADAGTAPAGAVVACSALRRAYRERLRLACPGLRFIFLDGASDVIAARLQQRQGHYMPASLLASQLLTLERPDPADPTEADVLHLDIDQPLARVVQQACAALLQALPATEPIAKAQPT